MSELIPAVYKCRQHQTELTAAVRTKVEAEPQKIQGHGHRSSTKRQERSFRVVVHCTASGGADDAGHDLVFSGTYRS